ncbi:hypothetical protein COLO4_35586 [Corchorus olitorius]|uniref:Uncharacterized protein n=1 Tax=Corchorus olitorius TaxID=93759 RepID=A0A1R3GF08_9ROSI|nr:hypothetical protein COLO4_35586 [Corchorus olitorius]
MMPSWLQCHEMDYLDGKPVTILVCVKEWFKCTGLTFLFAPILVCLALECFNLLMGSALL